jgi:hypothetical protein
MLDHDTDAYYKISRAFVDGQPSGGLTRPHPRQHHCVLADRHRGLVGPVVLGESVRAPEQIAWSSEFRNRDLTLPLGPGRA